MHLNQKGIIMLHLKRRFGKGTTIAAASAALIVAGTCQDGSH
jgi:hypothetical protein